MPTPDERMMTTDPKSSGVAGAWTPSRRGRYPNVKIKRGWEPAGKVGAGQAFGVGGIAFPGQPTQPPNIGEPIAPWLDPGQQYRPPQVTPGQGSSPFGGATATGGGNVNGGWGQPTTPYTPFQPGGGNVNPQGIQPSPSQMSGGAGDTGNNAPFYPPSPSRMGGGAGDTTPQRGAGGPAAAPRGGGGAPRGGGGGGAAASSAPSPDEMQTIARYAAAQWGVSFEEAIAELTKGAPEAMAYLQAALGMLRQGNPTILGFMGGGADVTQIGGGPTPPTPPQGGGGQGPAGSPGNPNQSGQPYYHPDDSGQYTGAPTRRDYGQFYQGNDVMRAASQYGTPVNATDMPGQPGVTLVQYSDGTSRPFNADGTFFSAPNPWGM